MISNPKLIHLPWGGEDPCPCGSGKWYKRCCRAVDGFPLIQVPRLFPPAPGSSFANSRCYLRGTNDCSEGINREHYISKNILEQLGATIEVSGFPWQKDNRHDRYSPKALVSKILCERHNSALSPLDQIAGRSFSHLSQAVRHALLPEQRKPSRMFLVSGQAIERWAIKVLLGLFHSGIARAQREKLIDSYTYDAVDMIRMLLNGDIPGPAGLYVRSERGGFLGSGTGFGIAALTDGTIVKGIRLIFEGLEFDVVTDGKNLPLGYLASQHRPTQIELVGTGTSQVIFTWSHTVSGPTITLTLDPTSAPCGTAN